MGMYDAINVKLPCPKCGTELSGFQSKDAGCNLELIDPEHVNEFYSSCPMCKLWVEYSRNPKLLPAKAPRTKPYTLKEVVKLGFTLVETDNEA